MQPKNPLEPLRRDAQNRALCTAMSKRSRETCNSPAMHGQRVCRMHGGSIPAAKKKAKLRLAELVDPAIGTLAREMTDQKNASRDKQAAANSILDRAGWGRVQKIETADAKEQLVERLLQMQAEEIEDVEEYLTEEEVAAEQNGATDG